jgi:CheY-like chemotaxis protein
LLLLVDDEERVRIGTVDLLRYEVVEADGAAAAFQILRTGLKSDLLVTDHLMPGQNGVKLARAARQLWPDLPALLISGYRNVLSLPNQRGDPPPIAAAFILYDVAIGVGSGWHWPAAVLSTTSLSLSIVYGFANQSDGHMRVFSKEGDGTTEKLYLLRYPGRMSLKNEPTGLVSFPRAEASETQSLWWKTSLWCALIVEVR